LFWTVTSTFYKFSVKAPSGALVTFCDKALVALKMQKKCSTHAKVDFKYQNFFFIVEKQLFLREVKFKYKHVLVHSFYIDTVDPCLLLDVVNVNSHNH